MEIVLWTYSTYNGEVPLVEFENHEKVKQTAHPSGQNESRKLLSLSQAVIYVRIPPPLCSVLSLGEVYVYVVQYSSTWNRIPEDAESGFITGGREIPIRNIISPGESKEYLYNINIELQCKPKQK